MSPRFIFALWAAKLSRLVIRLFGRDGSCVPGIIAVKLCPDFLARLKKPETLICVTGTNGKTTTSNLITSVLRKCGYEVTNNSTGSNVQGGVATALLADATLTGKPKKSIAVIEVDERSSLKVYRFITPDYLVCNNIMRDSLKRNAHTDFISYILNTALPPSVKVVLNGDDFICSHLFPDNRDRVYFGMKSEIPEGSVLASRDVVYCPECGTRLTADYVRFDHIGRIRCPGCGRSSEEPDYAVTAVDREGRRFTVSCRGEELDLRIVNDNIVNLYNCCGAVALLCEMGIEKEKIRSAFEEMKIVSSRYDHIDSGKLSITTQLSKGQNPVATARAFNYIASLPVEKKCLLIMIDDKSDNTKNSESVCWIYDTDYSALRDPSIDRIIFAGKRCRDHRLRALMAGVDPEKILTTDDLFAGAELVDCEKYENICILNDPYILKEAAQVRETIAKKGAAE